MTTRCKFKCDLTATRGSGENRCFEATLSPVNGGSAENKEFFKWSPNGILTLFGLKNQPFEAGKEYYLDISESVEAAPSA